MKITPKHQRIAAELAEAAVIGAVERIDEIIDDIGDDGPDTSLILNAVLVRWLAVTLVTAHGTEGALALLQSTKFDAALVEE